MKERALGDLAKALLYVEILYIQQSAICDAMKSLSSLKLDILFDSACAQVTRDNLVKPL